MNGPLILASASAARRLMLAAAGVAVDVIPADIDERALEAEMAAAAPQRALALALAKASTVSMRHPGRFVLGADQTLSLDGISFHKPTDRAAGHAQLAKLAGRTHHLHSGACLALDGVSIFGVVTHAAMTMRPLTDAAIARYLDEAGAAVLGSVGGYQVEGLGLRLFETIEGDHWTILGLPLLPVLAQLRARGALAW